jgi:hypothetical protein
MIPSDIAQPLGWAQLFVDWMHPLALICAVLFPILRSIIRFLKKLTPCFQTSYVVHDAASGFTIPSFLALVLSGLSPEIMSHVEGHAAALAGTMGIVYTIGGILKGHHDT